ncbi:MAG: Glu/Leu/Phe/Val dehydrogenase dimerization domain-containing protein [Bradymonadaceae bacterium]
MDLFNYANDLHYGEIHLKTLPEIGLQAIVAIHNLELGPAIGGCRFIEYPSSNAALRDALRLGRGMTYKAAISNLPHGGGKAVIVRPPNLTEEGRERIFTEFGKFIDTLSGRYITCEDSGTRVSDINTVRRHTGHALGYDTTAGSSGDPSPVTAFGVRRGIEAAAKFKWGRDDLEGLHVAMQGVGHVGYHLAKELHAMGVKLTITDINKEAVGRCVDEFGATAVDPEAVFSVECDIFAPCALGAAINDDTLKALTCEIVAGAANNQLAEKWHGQALKERGILYAPDYVINAGGLINVAQEYQGYDAAKAREKTSEVYDTMLRIFQRAKADDLPTHLVADRIVEEKIFGRVL